VSLHQYCATPQEQSVQKLTVSAQNKIVSIVTMKRRFNQGILAVVIIIVIVITKTTQKIFDSGLELSRHAVEIVD
jgi:hypothetical protein